MNIAISSFFDDKESVKPLSAQRMIVSLLNGNQNGLRKSYLFEAIKNKTVFCVRL